MPDLDRVLAARMRQIRARLGLTQEEFADLLGTNQPRISRFERGDSFGRLRELGHQLESAGLDPMDLLSTEEIADPVEAEIRDKVSRASDETKRIIRDLLRLQVPDAGMIAAEK